MAYKYGVPAFMAGQRHELQGDGVRLESPAFTFMARQAPRAAPRRVLAPRLSTVVDSQGDGGSL